MDPTSQITSRGSHRLFELFLALALVVFWASCSASLSTRALTLNNEKTTEFKHEMKAGRSKENLVRSSVPSAEVKDFERQDGVVVVTKIHDDSDTVIEALKQQYCLFMQAYNTRMIYDMVLFSTEEISLENQKLLRDTVHPAQLTIYTDETTLTDHVSELDDNRTTYLLNRCGVNSTNELSWHTRCSEKGATGGPVKLSYAWQSEFRSKWLWQHPGLAKYKYMLWMDSDTFCTKKWTQDPIAAMVRNDLVIMFANYPQGSVAAWILQDRIHKVFNRTLCRIQVADGHLQPEYQYGMDCSEQMRIGSIHGMFHITNLDFFRSPLVQKWVNTLIGDSKFSRKFDDQTAVTIAPAILAPNRSWGMSENGINLTVFHNGFIDGKRKWKGGYFLDYWERMGDRFPEAYGKCVVNNRGR